MNNTFRTLKILAVAALSVAVLGCGNSQNFVFTTPGIVNPAATVTGAILNPADATITLGRTTTYVLGLTFSDGTVSPATNVSYSSADPAIVTIDPDTGVAVGLTVGQTTITATDGTFTETTQVTVTAADVTQTPTFNVIVSNADDSDLDIFDTAATVISRTFDSMRNQGIVTDALGTGFHNGNTDLAIVNHLPLRDGTPAFQTTSFNGQLDRSIDLSNVANVAAKGSALAQARGILTIANFSTDAGTASLIVHGVAGEDGANEINIPTTSRPWDAAYDEANDRLYVAFTDGSIGVYDGWLANALGGAPSGTPTRTINISGLDNAHGIVLSGDTLIVSDVGPATMGGDPGFDTDGEIYLLNGASTASGAVTADAVIAGSNTILGNPVDIDLRNGDLRVAEKANDEILVFTDILVTPGGNLAPTVRIAYGTPESVTSLPDQLTLSPDASDIDGTNATVASLLVGAGDEGSSNTDGLFIRVDPGLTNQQTIFTFDTGDSSGRNMRGFIADRQGDVFVGSDSDYLFQLGRVANGSRDGDTFNLLQDREAQSTGQVYGVDVWDAGGLVFYAEDSNIEIAGKNADDQFVASLDAPNSNSVYDLDYDPIGDDLYVTEEDGNEIYVFENVVANILNPGSITVRTITVTGGNAFRGLVHDAANNRILVTDFGATESSGNVDGAIHIIANADTASGNVSPSGTIAGAATLLEDPEDLVYDGTFVYIADLDADLVTRFNISGGVSGTVNLAPEPNRLTVDGAVSLGFILQ